MAKPVAVSVIIPAFNAEDSIAAAILSAQQQTLRDVEIIVIDDASTDRTGEIVARMATQDPRLRYARMACNAGPSGCRNRGLALACGEWVALLDADDRFHARRLATLLGLGENVDVVSDNLLVCPQSGAPSWRLIPPSRLAAPRRLSFAAFITGCLHDPTAHRALSYVFMHPMIRREFLEQNAIRYDEDCRNGEDFLLYTDCFLAGARWLLTPEPFYFYTLREGSLTTRLSQADALRLVRRARMLMQHNTVRGDRALRGALRRYWRQRAGEYYYWGAKAALRAQRFRELLALLRDDRAAPLLVMAQALRRGLRRGRPA